MSILPAHEAEVNLSATPINYSSRTHHRWALAAVHGKLPDKPRSRYAVNSSGDTTEDQDGDSRFSDVILATILATKSDMCGKKFELKIDNVRFVGHPTLLQHALGQVRYEVRSGDRPPFQIAWLRQET
ncbi:hypothetical protein llap_16174 [Limosa lapponica baueri]|uniref:GATOR complex protein NPRL3 n=1 Tax=Limosa lapponica baueri TaxID=1758121 RepID=A0A2I0TI83_LIMLA|nr:hypothetical protein llap_16174 [Limosa lapponica baueri]